MQEVKKLHEQDLSWSSMEYKLWENGIQSQKFYWLQVVEGVSKLFWHEGARNTISIRCWDLP